MRGERLGGVFDLEGANCCVGRFRAMSRKGEGGLTIASRSCSRAMRFQELPAHTSLVSWNTSWLPSAGAWRQAWRGVDWQVAPSQLETRVSLFPSAVCVALLLVALLLRRLVVELHTHATLRKHKQA